jgi:hypothetical protein
MVRRQQKTERPKSMMLVSAVASLGAATCPNKEFDQCGGQTFGGEKCCPSYDACVLVNDFFSQCQPTDLCLTPMYGQCGGLDPITKNPWDPKLACCPDGFECDKQNDFYSQCSPSTKPTDCSAGYAQCAGQDGVCPPDRSFCTPASCACGR